MGLIEIVVGIVLFLLVVIVIGAAMEPKEKPKGRRDDSATPRRGSNAVRTKIGDQTGSISVEVVGQPTIGMFLQPIEQAISREDWAEARRALQKVAYGLVGPNVNPDDKREFTALMTRFAQRDPLYRETIQRLQPLVRERPGMMQSELTKGLAKDRAEALRYVLYFAAELGDVVRVKKGRSYQLFPPGVTIDSQ